MQARTINEILDELLAEKALNTTLNVLDNPSKTSIWYNLLALFAVETNILETLGEQLISELETRVTEIPSGTLIWYQVESLNYQFGDTLTIVDGVPVYAVIDETKRVVKQSAVEYQSGTLLIKAGKIDSFGNTVPLSAPELAGLQQYWIEKRFAGINIRVFSFNPDLVKAYIDIEINGQLLSLTGESISTPGTYPVIDAIKEYYKNVDYGGRFTIMELIDAIQSVPGTKNAVATSVLVTPDGGTVWQEVLDIDKQQYIAIAGYLAEDSIDKLSTTLNYYI